ARLWGNRCVQRRTADSSEAYRGAMDRYPRHRGANRPGWCHRGGGCSAADIRARWAVVASGCVVSGVFTPLSTLAPEKCQKDKKRGQVKNMPHDPADHTKLTRGGGSFCDAVRAGAAAAPFRAIDRGARGFEEARRSLN